MQLDISQCIPGKTKRIFKNPQFISRHLHCSICHEVFQNPMRVICGHTFCYACIQKWAGYTKKCPMCKQNITKRKLQKDYIPAQLIDQLQVQCSHDRCEWQGRHFALKKHQRICIFKKKNTVVTGSIMGRQTVQIIDDQNDNEQSCVMELQTQQKS